MEDRWRDGRLAAALILIAAIGLAGCGSAPTKPNALAAPELLSANPDYKQLRVAVIVSQATRRLSARDAAIRQDPNPQGYQYYVDNSVNNLRNFLREHFREIVDVDDINDPRVSGADLIAVIDYAVGITWTISFKTSYGATFVTPDKKELAAIRGYGKAWDTFHFQKAWDEALAAFARQLVTSPKLLEYARTRTASARAGMEPAPVANAPSAASKTLPSVDAPSYGFKENPDNYALVIGIDKYSGLPEARFAERDAAAVRAHLIALGYPERNILFLAGARALRSGIEKYVESWLPRNVKENSKVFVYFSGHGAPDPATGTAYLVPWDGDAEFLENTGYPVRRLYEKLGALRAREVLVVLDACFSGAGGRSVLAKGTRPLVTKVDAGSPAAGKLVVLTASGAGEVTGVEASQGHGLFTYHFLRGLEETKGGATVREIYGYLLPRVQESARRENRDQTPQLLPPDLGDKASDFLR